MRKAQPSAFTGKLKHPDLPFGLGLDYTDFPLFQSQGIKFLAKNGGTTNYTSWLLMAPDQGISLALVESGPASNSTKISFDVFGAVLELKGLIKASVPAVSPPAVPQPIPAEVLALAGYYITDGGRLVKIDFDSQKNLMTETLFNLSNGVEIPLGLFLYNKGNFYDASGKRPNSAYLTTIDGTTYLVNTEEGNDVIALQKLDKLQNPQNLKIDINGKWWLRRNVAPFEGPGLRDTHILKSSLNASLPGYVVFSGAKAVQSPEFAGMVGNSRDQTELTLINKDGQTWAQNSEMLYMSSDTASALKAGENTVTIGTSGYNEWLTSGKDSILSFKIPAKDRAIVFSSDGSTVYDSAIDSGGIFIKQGSFVELDGQIGDTLTVTVQ
jgi:hypothetical protein